MPTKIQCERCKKIFTHKNDYQKHLNRKNPCEPNSHADDVFTLHVCKACGEKFGIEYLKNHVCLTPEINKILSSEKVTKADKNKPKNITINGGDNAPIVNADSGNVGDINATSNTNASNTKKITTNKRNTNNTKKIINNRRNANNASSNISNIRIITTAENPYANLLPFGEEKASKLTIGEINRIVGSRDPFKQLLQILYFNPNNVDHHNVYLNDYHCASVRIFDNGWNLQPLSDVIATICVKCLNILKKIYEFCGKHKYPPEILGHFKDLIDKAEKSYNSKKKFSRTPLYRLVKNELHNNRKFGRRAWQTTKHLYKKDGGNTESNNNYVETLNQHCSKSKIENSGQFFDLQDEYKERSKNLLSDLFKTGKISSLQHDKLQVMLDNTHNSDHWTIIHKNLEKMIDTDDIDINTIKEEIAQFNKSTKSTKK